MIQKELTNPLVEPFVDVMERLGLMENQGATVLIHRRKLHFGLGELEDNEHRGEAIAAALALLESGDQTEISRYAFWYLVAKCRHGQLTEEQKHRYIEQGGFII